MRPRPPLLALLLFAMCVYLLPVQAVLRHACTPLAFGIPTWSLAGLPPLLEVEVNLRYILVLVAAYALFLTLVALALRLLRAYEWDEALDWLATVITIKDLRGLDRLLISVVALATVGLTAAIPFWHTEGIAVLAGMTCFSLGANVIGQPREVIPIPSPRSARRLPQADATDGDVRKVYTWQYPGNSQARSRAGTASFTVELAVSQSRYAENRDQPRERNLKRWDIYVTAPIPEVEVLAGKLLALGRDRGYCSLEQVCNTLAFTQQCIRYEPDCSPETSNLIDSPKYPIESLIEESGDCADQAILAAALLKRMGFDVALLFCPGHAAIGVAGAEHLPGAYVADPVTGVRFFYAETTADGWHLGELPEDVESYLLKGQLEMVPVVMRVS